MQRFLQHTLLFSMLSLAMSASAQGDDMFAMADSNKDGRISTQEHASAAQAMFAKMDANHDGKCTAEEMAAGDGMKKGGMDHGGMMAMMDTNHDGVLTRDENAAAAQARFDRMDPDHDGRITADEMAAAHKMMGEQHPPMGGMDHGGMVHGDMEHAEMKHGDIAGMSGGMMAGMHDRMDANKDGVVTTAEHAAGAKAMFARMDSNKDGYLSKVEMQAGRAMKK
ncbi:MAG: hypothetical protein LH470_08740 [Lysobacter sp.]|nr:hypothetical protein [Lysobacter sp.]